MLYEVITDEKKIASKPVLGILFATGIMTFLLVQTNQYHNLFYSRIGVDSSYGFNVLVFKRGLWYTVQGVTLYVSLLYSIAVYIHKIAITKGSVRKRAVSYNFV